MSGIKIGTKDRTVEFGVMSVPNRKSKCLYRVRGTMIETLAYFRSDQAADEFEDIIDFMVKTLKGNK